MIRTIALAVVMVSATVQAAAADSIVWQTQELRVEITEDGCLRSVRSVDGAAEYLCENRTPEPIAAVYRGGVSIPAETGKYAALTGRWMYQGGQSFPATAAAWDGQRLRIEFRGAGATATYRVRVQPEHIAMELADLAGEPVDRIDLFHVKLKRLPCLGRWVNVAFDDRFGICLCGATLNTLVEMDQAAEHVVLRATAEKEAGLDGATAVLLGCRNPRRRFLEVMDSIERDFDLPRGARHRRMTVQRYSYLWASRPTPANIDRYIHWAKRGGSRMLLFSYWAFSKGAGQFDWNADYPRGMADLKQVTDAIRGAGLKLGLHIHYSKAYKTDRYVTPVPDSRLHLLRRFTLAADVDAAARAIRVVQAPAGCTLDAGRRVLRVGGELIAYEHYTAEPPYQFTGCQRGYHKTRPASHKHGDTEALLDADTWPDFIRFDQTTDIQDEAARRIAEIYRETGPYDTVYFDGAEDVHRPYWYHVASAQYRVYRLLDPPRAVCKAAHYTHFSWHMITRSNGYDIVASAGGMKAFCRLMPCPTAAARSMDSSRVDFGWLGRFGASPFRQFGVWAKDSLDCRIGCLL